MYNFSLLVAVIAGMVVLDILIQAFIKSWKDVLGEVSCVMLLIIIASLLSFEGVTEQIGDNFTIWCLGVIAIAASLVTVGVHLVEVVGTDHKQKRRDKENCTKTPVRKVNK